MFYSKKSSLIKWFDKQLNGPLYKQLIILLLMIIIVVFIWTFVIYLFNEFFFDIDKDPEQSPFWWTLIYFFDPGNMFSLTKPGSQFFSVLIALTGLILLGGILISVITNYYFQRIQKLKTGRAKYKFSNHFIIIGFDPITPNYIIHLYNESQKSEILIHTSQNAENVSRKLRSFLPSQIEKNIFVLQGERNSIEEIQRLHPEKSKRIIILGEPDEKGHDSLNIDCANKIAEEIKNKSHELKDKICSPIPIYVFFIMPQIFQLSKEFEYFDSDFIHFLPFNFYENWARLIFQNTGWIDFKTEILDEVYVPVDQYKIKLNSNLKAHFVVLGFNSMGHAIVSQLARVCHFPNKQTTTITIIDHDLKEKENLFYAQNPGIKNIYDISFEFVEDDYNSSETRGKIEKIANSANTLSYVIICFKEPDLAISAGVNLPVSVYEKEVPILIRQEYLYGFNRVVQKNIKFFGMRDICLFDNILDDSIAESAHLAFLNVTKELKWYNPDNESYIDWE
ncbi:MAG: hypothetical protein HOG79_16440, partial [Prolixibacteraceae bacterium]|nr:hypothetical protein [Prolixibacteraceae bacterium]